MAPLSCSHIRYLRSQIKHYNRIDVPNSVVNGILISLIIFFSERLSKTSVHAVPPDVYTEKFNPPGTVDPLKGNGFPGLILKPSIVSTG